VITRDAAHRYTFEGVQYPGVTSILDVLDKSFPLMTWAARETATAAVNMATREERDALTALDVLILETGKAGAIKALSSRANWTRDEAAQLGTEVHALADKLVRGIPLDFMTPTQRLRVEHYAKWWEQLLAGGAKLRLSEAMVCRPNDPDNPQSGWGGTFDLLYYDADGCTVLADIKTGGKWGRKAYESEILQVTAYGLAKWVQPAVENVLTETPKVYPMPMPDKYKLIHVTAEGCKPIDVDVTVRERMAFLACLVLYHWVESQKGKRI
jgi:hypothetical protein